MSSKETEERFREKLFVIFESPRIFFHFFLPTSKVKEFRRCKEVKFSDEYRDHELERKD